MIEKIESLVAKTSEVYQPVKLPKHAEFYSRFPYNSQTKTFDHPVKVQFDTKTCKEIKPYAAISHTWSYADDNEDGTRPHTWSHADDSEDVTQPTVDSKNTPRPLEVEIKVQGENTKWCNTFKTSSWSWNLEKIATIFDIVNDLDAEKVWWDWKDIDQVDAKTKTEQVRHMPEIYRTVEVVIIIHTCDILRHTLSNLRNSSPSFQSIASDLRKALNKTRYRKRVWTLQEETLAKTKCHIIIDGRGKPVVLSRSTFHGLIANDCSRSEFELDPYISEIMNELFGDPNSSGMSSERVREIFLNSNALSTRKATFAKDLYFAIAAPCDISLNLDYEFDDRRILTRWAKYLLENNILTACWKGYEDRYTPFAKGDGFSWIPFYVPVDSISRSSSESTLNDERDFKSVEKLNAAIVDSFSWAISLTKANLTTWNHFGVYSGEVDDDGNLAILGYNVPHRVVCKQNTWNTSASGEYYAFVYRNWIEFKTTCTPRESELPNGELSVSLEYQLSGCRMIVVIPERFASKLVFILYTAKGSAEEYILLTLKNDQKKLYDYDHYTLLCSTKQPTQIGRYDGERQLFLIR
ncbi:hypothetical protein HK098_005385 [Nowakowskiella sp. JEL0407]|nr:hypothetical protein HK098_005385 [Nowakowskiella sp. JEL0407]